MLLRRLFLIFLPTLLLVLIPRYATTQHEVQTYKTISHWVTLKECDADISMVYLTALDDEKLRRIVDKRLIILQWAYDLKDSLDKEDFFVMDLIAKFGQLTYRIEILGKNKDGKEFYNVLYISSVGISYDPIEKAPVREEYTKEWKESDKQAILKWITGHQFSPKGLEAKYSLLEHRGSLQVDVPLIVRGSPDCKVLKNGEV